MIAYFAIVVGTLAAGVLRLDLPPDLIDPARAVAVAPPEAAANEQAVAAWKQARSAAQAGRASDAYRLTYSALHADPAFADARKLLGYVPFRETWCTTFASKQLAAGKVWHAQFGWLPEADVARYDQGERYFRGRWMPVETEAKLRIGINQGWRVETEHYNVLTNDSLQTGVALGQRLEQIRAVWWQLFAGFVLDEAELTRQFGSQSPRKRIGRQHKVIVFRNQAEYQAALEREQPNIAGTLGIYFDKQRTAYFFAGDQQHTGTLWHEAAHQLFTESANGARDVGRKHNFWVIEGVACYFESAAPNWEEGYVSMGGAEAGRLPAARQRLLEDNFYVPLAELVTLGMADVQANPNIAKLYSQFAGLATFFMQADDGQYREPFVAYLRAVYDGRADETTLSRLMNKSYAELDQAYRQWLQSQ
jgi:hypothetical protein